MPPKQRSVSARLGGLCDASMKVETSDLTGSNLFVLQASSFMPYFFPFLPLAFLQYPARLCCHLPASSIISILDANIDHHFIALLCCYENVGKAECACCYSSGRSGMVSIFCTRERPFQVSYITKAIKMIRDGSVLPNSGERNLLNR